MKANILFVDDEINVLKALEKAFALENYNTFFAQSAEVAFNILKSCDINVIVTDMIMPEIGGSELLRIIDKYHPNTIKIVLSGQADIAEIAKVINNMKIFKLLLKPWDMENDLKPAINSAVEQYYMNLRNSILSKKIEENEIQLKKQLEELKIKNIKLERMAESLDDADSIIMALAYSVECRDALTNDHIKRVANYAEKIGEMIGFSDSDLSILKKGAILHDIGKIGISDSILNKPSALTSEETEIMKTHTIIGGKIIGSLKSFKEIENIVRNHHEKLNGSGYPAGLSGNEIDIFTRIVTVIDIYDALTMDRPYRKAMSPEQAVEILLEDAQKGEIDKDIVKIMLGIVSNIGSGQMLTDRL